MVPLVSFCQWSQIHLLRASTFLSSLDMQDKNWDEDGEKSLVTETLRVSTALYSLYYFVSVDDEPIIALKQVHLNHVVYILINTGQQ